jgi:hypothetical protein
MFQYTYVHLYLRNLFSNCNNCAYNVLLLSYFADSSATLSLMNRIQIDYEIEFRKKLMHNISFLFFVD